MPDGFALEAYVIGQVGERQTVWTCLDLARNLFKSTNAAKLADHMRDKVKQRQVEDCHFALFPGLEIPNPPASKHVKKDETTQGDIFLKKRLCQLL